MSVHCGMLVPMLMPSRAKPPSAAVAAEETAILFPRVRWMGSKYRLLPHLAEVFQEVGGTTALDAFSGSGVVSYLLKRQGFSVHSNDYLEFPATIARASVVNQATRFTDADVEQITGPSADGRNFIQNTLPVHILRQKIYLS
jgi:hypothetical protein